MFNPKKRKEKKKKNLQFAGRNAEELQQFTYRMRGGEVWSHDHRE